MLPIAVQKQCKRAAPKAMMQPRKDAMFQPFQADINRWLTRWLLGLVLAACVLCLGPLTMAAGAQADELAPAPAELFETHCAGCHLRGGNIIRRGKTLKQRALKRYGYDTKAAIIQIITQGKAPMSSYADQLSPKEIQTLAQYVIEQADQGWPR